MFKKLILMWLTENLKLHMGLIFVAYILFLMDNVDL